jgi:hypothetical protein
MDIEQIEELEQSIHQFYRFPFQEIKSQFMPQV